MPKQLYIIIGLFILSSCANQTQPTGGPMDEDPPKLISSIPEQGSVNYTDTEIRLLFDEDVRIQNPRTQILITPRTQVEYEIRARRTEVILEFDSLLDSNTTYSINFREAVEDITEGNSAINLQLAFSTGPQLDSLSLTGRVYRMYDGNSPEKATVVLYRLSDTTDIFTGEPYYYTQTLDSGLFKFQNLKAGPYKLYAYQDYNNNLTAQPSSEPYAFYPDTLLLQASDSMVYLPLVNLDIGEFRQLSARNSGIIYISRYNKAVFNFYMDSADSLFIQPDPQDPTTLQFYPLFESSYPDSSQVILTVSDSIQQTITDTLYVKFNYESTRSSDFNLTSFVPPVVIRKPQLNAHFTFTQPARFLNTDSIFIQLDSINLIPFDSLTFIWNEQHTDLDIQYLFSSELFKQNQDNTQQPSPERRQVFKPILILGNHAFQSALLDTLSSYQFNLSFKRDRDLSRFILRLQTDEEYFIVQLLRADEVYREIRNPETDVLYFNDLEPGNYNLRVIIDSNNNGRWDPGNIKDNIPPEQIIYYVPATGERDMDIRANFDWDETFKF
jgi:hypothetical protein